MKKSLFSFFLIVHYFQLLNAQNTAVCVYEKAIIRQAPSQKSEIVSAISFGKEKVYLTNEKITVPEEKNRIYEKVNTEEGETGWVRQELLVMEGQGAVARVNTIIYPQANANPQAGFSGEFKEGESLIKTEQEGDFVKVYGFEKKKEGWVLVADLMDGEEEIAESVWLTRAMQEKSDCERATKMLAVKNSPMFEINQMTDIVERAYKTADSLCKNPPVAKPIEQQPANRGLNAQPKPKTPTSTTKPTTKASVSPAKPTSKPTTPTARTINNKSNTPAKVIGTAANISAIAKLEGKVGNAHKYVEKLQVVEVTDANNSNKLQCYHNTLPKGAKIMVQLPNNEGEVELEVIGGLKTKAGLGLTNPTIKRIFGEKIPRFVDIYYLAK